VVAYVLPSLGSTGVSKLVEYEPRSACPGLIGRMVSGPSPTWPVPLRARGGAPGVLWFVLDDVGSGTCPASAESSRRRLPVDGCVTREVEAGVCCV